MPTLDYTEDAFPVPLLRKPLQPFARALVDEPTTTTATRPRAWGIFLFSAVLILGASAAAAGAAAHWVAPVMSSPSLRPAS